MQGFRKFRKMKYAIIGTGAVGGFYGGKLANAGKEVHIIWDLLLEHKSSGCANHEFYNNCEILWKKWKNEFPIMKGVNLSIPEEKVRTKLVELNRIIRIQEDEIYRINNICQSYAYRLCSLILTPIKKIRKWLK